MLDIFEPVRLGSLELPNRLVGSATHLGLAGPKGEVTDELLGRYAEFGAGGAGLVVTGNAFVSPEGRSCPGILGASDDGAVPGLRRLARTIQAGGARAALQIAHAGGQTRSEWIDDQIPVAPSLAFLKQYPDTPRELYREEITRIVKAFGAAARRAREAGFDAVEVHAAHGLLISQFLSPAANHRQDRYGGDLAGRFRFLQEVLTAVQWAAGHDFPVLVKLNGADYVDGGLELREAAQVAEWLSSRGAAAIDVSGGTAGSGEMGPVRPVVPGRDEAYFRDLAASLRGRVSCPVILVGGLRSLETLEELLMFGTADLFGLSRPLLCEPDLPRRWASGDRAPARCASAFRPLECTP
jgi:2,4-dienoyl-CoA reductase-like NADH-dependent reductase (Old Yellow Enzyme family)